MKHFKKYLRKKYAAFGGKEKYEEAMKRKLPCAPIPKGKKSG